MIPRTAWIFLAFWLLGAALATWDRDVCFGLMFAMVGVMAVNKKIR